MAQEIMSKVVAVFEKNDEHGDGTISVERLAKVLQRLGLTDPEIQILQGCLGEGKNGRINYADFLRQGQAAIMRLRHQEALQYPVAALGTASECRLRIFHINDVYVLDNLPRLRSCIQKMSEGFPRANVLTTLAGDFLAPSLLSSVDHGRGMVDVMNHVPVDAVCFGNHESDIPHTSLLRRIKEYRGKWLNSNMRSFSDGEKDLPDNALPDNQLIQLEGGRSVALIGLLRGGGKAAVLYRKRAFNGHAAKITPVLEAVDDAVARARAAYPSADCIIPLTHQDMPDDIAMTARGHKFPVILGGHDHSVFNEVHNGTLVIKAGEDAFNVAVIDLIWAAGAPVQSSPTTVNVQLAPLALPRKYKGPPLELEHEPDAALQEIVQKWQKPADELRKATLAVLDPGGWMTSVGVRKHEVPMATMICCAMRDVCRADGAVINAGAVRGNKVYMDGTVGFADLNAEVPFPSEQLVVSIDGSVLSNAVAHSRQPWDDDSRSSDALHCDDGMEVDETTLHVVKVKGKPIEPSRLYTIVIDSYLMRSNEVLKEYADAYPDRIPPDDSGRPALPILVQYFCDKVWAALIGLKEGNLDTDQVDRFLDEVDVDRNGELNVEELMAAMSRKLGGLDASRVLAQQCLSYADADKNRTVSRTELKDFLRSEAAARTAHMDHDDDD